MALARLRVVLTREVTRDHVHFPAIVVKQDLVGRENERRVRLV